MDFIAEPKLIRALRKHYEALREAASYNIEAYLHSPVGIGQHGDLFSEAKKLLETIDQCNSVLATIDAIVESNSSLTMEEGEEEKKEPEAEEEDEEE